MAKGNWTFDCAGKNKAKESRGTASAVVAALLAKALELDRAETGTAILREAKVLFAFIEQRMDFNGINVYICEIGSALD